MDRKFLAQFASPSSLYRGKPFWAWNGKLEPEELRRQVRVFHRMGLGGFFMHSRVGLATEYLGKEWFDCTRACIDEARKLGMEAWLYDEDRWPSGAAGGLVTKNPKYRQRSIWLQQLTDPKQLKWTSATLAAFVARIDGTSAYDVARIPKGKRPPLAPGQTILLFSLKVADPSPWFNMGAYLNTLDPAAVREYIRVTHEAYRKRIGKDFGNVVPGIFTDEPCYGWEGDDARPWTDKLPAIFRQRYGYDLLERSVELFFDVQGIEVSQARYHYFDLITSLFVDSFGRQIFEWCRKNRMRFTGHVMAEDTTKHQTSYVGSAMRFYEYMQSPGMDLLTEQWRSYLTAKQVSSASRQFGRAWRLTETYGCTGWDFAFEAHKAIGDWQAALGINLRCPHLSFYTMQGEAKRDYPASIFYQSPWWELYATVEDYYARIHVAMTRGQEVRDLLVIHPIESTWAIWRRGSLKDPRVEQRDRMIEDVLISLLSEQIDFDLGDEEILSRHAKIARTPQGATFKVAKATYRAVLVPPMLTMRKTTLELLRKFAAAGGTVVFAGDVAKYVDALPSPAPAELAATCPRAPEKGKPLADAVAPTCRRISVTDAAGNAIAPAFYMLREDRAAFYLLVVNTSHIAKAWNEDAKVRDRKAAFDDVRIRGFASCKGAPVELEPSTGKFYAAKAAHDSSGWEIHTSLPRLGSRLFVIPKQAGQPLPPRPKPLRDVRSEPLSGGPWNIQLSEANNLVLDRPRYKIGKGDWQGPEEILRVDRAVRAALKVPNRGGAMVQPWAQEKPAHPKSVPLVLSYEFNVQALPSGELALCVEQPQTFQIAVNGQSLSVDAAGGWWVDRSLRKVPLDPSLLRPGRNEITLTCAYDQTHSGLEAIYLLGHFGTRVEGTELTITPIPQMLELGDWVAQGLTFYGGSVSYRRTIAPQLSPGQRLVVRVRDYRGVALRVLVDSKPAGVIAWEPSELDITDFLHGQSAELSLEVIGHRRNSHGPLHLNEKWPMWTGPGSFTTTGDKWIDGYQLVPCGLMTPPELVVRE